MEGKKLRIAGVTLAATLMSGTAYANNGADLLGQQVVDFGGSTESIRDLFQKRGGGKILAAGQTDANDLIGGTKDMLVARILLNSGLLDPTFGAGGWTTVDFGFLDDSARWVHQRRGRSIVVAGTGTAPNGTGFLSLARLGRLGQLAGITQVCPDSTLTAAFRSRRGDFLLAGNNTSFDGGVPGDPDTIVAHVLPDGTLDTSSGGNNGCPASALNDLRAETPVFVGFDPTSQKIHVVTAIRADGLVIYRFNADGTHDTTFGPNNDGMVAYDALTITATPGVGVYVTDATVRPGGEIVAVGHAGLVGAGDPVLLQYLPDGTPDTTFGPNNDGINLVNTVDLLNPNAVALDNRGRVIMAGGNATTGEVFVARFRRHGRVDRSFGTNGATFTNLSNGADIAFDVLVLKNRRIMVAGSAGPDAFWAVYRGRN